ncbi:MAG: hypothetical protein AB7P21_07810 [Lautropia sp.]
MNRVALGLSLMGTAAAAHAQGRWMAVLGDGHTSVFIAFNILLTFYFVWRFDRFAVVHGPEILTTVGIFGCFLGIAMALLDFDASNVSASVPQLLDGVKTAFWASVSGVGGALVIRFRHQFQRKPINLGAGAPKGATLDDVVTSLQSLQRSLSGDAEGSLLSQLKMMRQDQADQLGALRVSFDTFAKRMAKDGSQALIDALRVVIADFNAKITEQFGDNFRQLNQAVEKLVVWQAQYRTELEQLQRTNAAVSASLSEASSNLGRMVVQSEGFVTSAEKLESLVLTVEREYDLMLSAQQSMVEVLSQMRSVTPEFSAKFDQMLAAIRVGVDGLVDTMNASTTRTGAEMEAATRNLGARLQAAQAELQALLADTARRTGDDVLANLTKSGELMRRGVETLDQGMQEELNRSLEIMGRQLASLSEKFVRDYEPLTVRLREVVAIAERVG